MRRFYLKTIKLLSFAFLIMISLQSCKKEEPPTSMEIVAVKATRFPATNAGASWDTTPFVSDADLYFTIETGSTLVYEYPNFILDASQQTQDFGTSFSINLNDPEALYLIKLYDYDSGSISDELMGTVNFFPYTQGEDYPTTIEVDNGGAVAFELTVKYNF